MNAHTHVRIFQLYTRSSSAVLGLLHLNYFLVQFKKYSGTQNILLLLLLLLLVVVVVVVVVLVLVLVFNPWASLGRYQSPVRQPVWLWHAASWASSLG